VWPDWLKAIQLKPRFLFALFALGLLILLLPSRIADTFGLNTIRENHRHWVGLATLAAFIFWCVQLVPYFKAKQRLRRLNHSKSEKEDKAFEEEKAEIRNLLQTLSDKEAMILAYCLYKKHRTITLPLTDAAANSLCHKGLLIRATGMGMPSDWPFTIPDFVWEELKESENEILPQSELQHMKEVFEDFEHYKNRMY
jgi:hypothetical protein